MQKGTHQTTEAKERIRAFMLGEGNPHRGKKLTDDHKAKLRQTALGQYSDAEFKKKWFAARWEGQVRIKIRKAN